MAEKIAVIGSGGREHALAAQVVESHSIAEVVSLPGNPGMAELGECFPVDLTNSQEIAHVAAREGVDLAIVGPEIPLVAGVVDELERYDIAALGPHKAAAQLEGSKAFMKDLAWIAGIPTAEYQIFCKGEEGRALGYYESFGEQGAVIKADGLAGGKGVALPKNSDEARGYIEAYLSGRAFGSAGEVIVIEKRLQGREVSLMALCDGHRAIALEPARDYKRLLDDDRGPNTGGMGSYSPVEDVPPELVAQLMEVGVDPLLHYMNEQRIPYRGILYAGFMLTEEGPKVLEYNARFGDPETQVIVPRLTSDLAAHCRESAEGKLRTPVGFSDDTAVTIALTAPGYPENPQTGASIEGLEQVKEVTGKTKIFHGGTAIEKGRLVTAGGRVLYATGFGPTVEEARYWATAAANKIHWPGMHRRTDVAQNA